MTSNMSKSTHNRKSAPFSLPCPVTFDRAEIRKQIEPMPYNEARRRKGPVYEVLIEELFESSCVRSACYLRLLVDKETEMYADAMIRDRMCDDLDLLWAGVDLLKSAELAAKAPCKGGPMKTTRALYDIILLIESRGDIYDWLLTLVYVYIVEVVEEIAQEEDCCRELKTRLFYRYARFLSKSSDTYDKSLVYLRQALNLCSGELWTLERANNEGQFEKLNSAAAILAVEVLLKYAKLTKTASVESAVNMAIEAVKFLAQSNMKEHKEYYYRARLVRIHLLMEDSRNENAMKVLIAVKKELLEEKDERFLNIQCEVIKLKGECHIRLHEEDLAKEELQIALNISLSHGFKALEAETRLNLGRLYMHHIAEKTIAKAEFTLAKTLFTELNDVDGRKKTQYLLALLKTEEIYNFYVDAVKDAPYKYCTHHRLRRWKNNNKPFWENIMEKDLEEEKDSVICLMKEGNPVVGKCTIDKAEYMRVSVIKDVQYVT